MLGWVVVSYDIGCQRRRQKAARYLLDHGERVQESVYELLLRRGEWEVLCGVLDGLIDPVEDQWRAWPLCEADHADAIQLGLPSPEPPTRAVIV